MAVVLPEFLLTLAEDPSQARLGGTDGPDLTRYIAVCAGLLLAVAALAWGFRKWVAKAVAARAAQRSLAVIDVLPLAGKQKLAVVRCYDRTFLLGLGEREVGLVAELDAVLEPRKAAAASSADDHGFAQVLAKVRGAATAGSRGFVA